jgi:bifunctional non-homologous end joining protein LigD
MNQKIKVDSRSIPISHPSKILFPGEGISKRGLVDYYQRIAEIMLPHLQGRPLTMERFPDGIDEGGFYQKEAPEYFPDWIRRVSIPVKETGQEQPQLVCDSLAGLVYLVDQGCLTFHPWLSRADKLDYPDKLIFDLDPPGQDFEPVRFAAQALHQMLNDLGLTSFVMTTGSSGLHIVIPLDRSLNFEASRKFAKELSELLAARDPDKLTTEISKEKRAGRLFLDYLRNSYGQNSIAPYTVRPLAGAPVATPLRWDELANPKLDSQSYMIGNIFRRLGQMDDPWKNIYHQAVSLDDAWSRLEKIKGE